MRVRVRVRVRLVRIHMLVGTGAVAGEDRPELPAAQMVAIAVTVDDNSTGRLLPLAR